MNEQELYFEDVLKRRYAARRFKDIPVDKDKINRILEMGRIAPTAKNMQPQRIYVATKSDDLKRIDEVSRCRYNAPLVFIVCSNKLECWNENGKNSCEMDASIVATHMMLEATNIGVDNIWIELFDKERLKELFNLPEEIEPIALLPMGYSDIAPSPLHNSRKELSETVIFL